MKNQYRMYVRGKHSGGTVWWCEDNATGKRESLRTTDKNEAKRLLDLKNQPQHFRGFHVQMARTHLLVSDPKAVTRTWQNVMDTIVSQKTGSTKIRWERAAQCKAFDSIRNQVVADTKADEFLAVLGDGKVSSNVYLRRLHNFALDMNWLLAPVQDASRGSYVIGIRASVLDCGGPPPLFNCRRRREESLTECKTVRAFRAVRGQ